MSNTLRIAGVVRESVVDGNGIRFVIFTQGCPHNCVGCHNPESHDAKGGYDCEIEKIMVEIKKNPLLSGVTFSGGEPLLQIPVLSELAKKVRAENLGLIIYTGYRFEELLKRAESEDDLMELLAHTDVLIDGKFELENKDLTLKFRGSSNQRCIDVQESLRQNSIVLHEWD